MLYLIALGKFVNDGCQESTVKIHRVRTDLRLTGKYKIKGTAMGFIPVDSADVFSIDIKGFSLSVIAHVSQDDEKGVLVVHEPGASIHYDDAKFKFEKLMGGGAIGSTANLVINTVGQAIVNSQKKSVVRMIKKWSKQAVKDVI